MSSKIKFSLFRAFACICLCSKNSAASELGGLERRFDIKGYQVTGKQLKVPVDFPSILSPYTGTNLGVDTIAKAASSIQAEYSRLGFPLTSVSVSPGRMTNGILTFNVYQAAVPTVLIGGEMYSAAGKLLNAANVAAGVELASSTAAAGATNAAASSTNAAATTNEVPHFTLKSYDVAGITLLPKSVLPPIFEKHFGTNVTFGDVSEVQKALQLEYHNRGYDSVMVTVPMQRLTNDSIRLVVMEGKLAEIVIKGNHYYGTNNILRSLPSLKTNIFLNSKIFQAELDRANANQDRQVYPKIAPGPETNTSALILTVKDRLPLHGKVDFNNQNSPGTPNLRVNSSAVYNNLWDQNHSLGVQYSFSPEALKSLDKWAWYDRPLVANYSAFYRMPLTGPEAVGDKVAASQSGAFGYNEATRKFQLPNPTGGAEINMFASRSTIDSGVNNADPANLFSSVVRSIDQQRSSEDLTVNQDIGFRLSKPLPEFDRINSTLSAGMGFKTYDISSFSTNSFIFTEHLFDTSGNPFTRVSRTPSPVPFSRSLINYLPLSFRWDANRQDKYGRTDIGFNYSPNLWHSGNRANIQSVAGSTKSSGYWNILGGSLAREQAIGHGWKASIRADGQWSSEPLISNEQFGAGGIGGVRGYSEGESFGDTGWRIFSEIKTPPSLLGPIDTGSKTQLTLRGTVFMDYAETYLLDPQFGQAGRTRLWGTGAGAVAALGSGWEARLIFGVPLLKTANSNPGQLRINFSLISQF